MIREERLLKVLRAPHVSENVTDSVSVVVATGKKLTSP